MPGEWSEVQPSEVNGRASRQVFRVSALYGGDESDCVEMTLDGAIIMYDGYGATELSDAIPAIVKLLEAAGYAVAPPSSGRGEAG